MRRKSSPFELISEKKFQNLFFCRCLSMEIILFFSKYTLVVFLHVHIKHSQEKYRLLSLLAFLKLLLQLEFSKKCNNVIIFCGVVQ